MLQFSEGRQGGQKDIGKGMEERERGTIETRENEIIK
jgi:hypothetical protein